MTGESLETARDIEGTTAIEALHKLLTDVHNKGQEVVRCRLLEEVREWRAAHLRGPNFIAMKISRDNDPPTDVPTDEQLEVKAKDGTEHRYRLRWIKED